MAIKLFKKTYQVKKTRYNIEKYHVFQLCQKYKENQIERNKTKYEQRLPVLRYCKYEWHFVVPPFLCHSAFGTFFQWTWIVFTVTIKLFEEERIKYIPYPKQDLRHWETGRKGIRKQMAPARQETTKYLYGEMELAICQEPKRPLHFMDVLFFLFTKEICMVQCLRLRKLFLD